MTTRLLMQAGTASLPKSPTGIAGLDEVTAGGLPRGRPTLVCGSAGSGKTLLAMEFLLRGATQFGEPGVFMAFEENADELTANFRSIGFDIDDLVRRDLLSIDHVRVERSEIEETGEYDLEALFVRLGYAIDSIGARRVALDTLEALFAGFSNASILRAELRRLFRWLKDRGVTAVITGERGEGTLTRQGLEEYVSDCVILLDHRVIDQVATRRLRVVKYRGTLHGTNEYPFLIGENGIEVLPVTSLGLSHAVTDERVTTGVEGLDAMLGGRGVYRGSSVLITGTAGIGKTSIACHFADATCARGESCVYFAFEESERQVARNMRSIGLDLARWIRDGRLVFHSVRPSVYGLEMHLAMMHRLIRDVRPGAVVIDPISSFDPIGTPADSKAMLVRMLDHLKSLGVTVLMTGLTHGGKAPEATDEGISSLIDTWILLRDIETNGERNRGVYVLKSRGMEHSNQIREFLIGSDGIRLLPVYLGAEGIFTGSARLAQEARGMAEADARAQEALRRRRAFERRQKLLKARIEALSTALEEERQELEGWMKESRSRDDQRTASQAAIARSRRVEGNGPVTVESSEEERV